MTTRNELVFNKVKIQPNADVTGTGTKFLTDVDPTLTGNLTLGSAPSLPNHAVTKQYADALVSGLDVKDSVRVATTVAGGNIVLATGGLLTIDGVTLVNGDRVLVKNQTDSTENGIYVAHSGAWLRSDDADNTPFNEVSGGMFTFTEEGTVNGDYGFVLNSITGNAVLGTSSLLFTQFSGAGSIIPGDGLSATGNVFNVGGTTNRITVSADNVDIASTYVGQTSITTLGTIGLGTWQGSSISTTYTDAKIKTVTGTSNRLDITGTSTDPIFDISSTYVGQASITTLGTITTGVWAGTVVAANHGGTGFTSYTLGDTLYADTTSTLAKLAGNITTAVQVLSQTGTGSVSAAPVWLTLSTSNVTEGTNLYWTQLRFDTAFGLKTTDNLTEGTTNFYYHNSLVDAHLSGTTNRITYTAGVIDISSAYVGQTSITTTGTMTVGKISTGYKIGGVTMELGSDATGDLYYNNAGVLTRRVIGSTNDFLKVVGGVPTWEALSNSNVTTALGYTPVNKAGDTMTGFLTLSADPTSALHAATKQYVDAVATGLDLKQSVRVMTSSPINLATIGLASVDSVTVVDGDRVLVTGQTFPEENGIYIAHSGAWTRSSDADSSAEVTAGLHTFVSEGTVYGNTQWVLTTNDPITLGTTELVFSQFSGAGAYIAGNGLDLTGNTFSVNVDNVSIEIVTDTLQIKSTWVGQTSITTLGTIGFGTWQGSSISTTYTDAKIKTVTGTANRLTITGTSTDPIFDIASTYVGQASITTLGTITAGVWNGTTIAVANGGTGATTLTGVLIGNGTSAFTTVVGTNNTLVKFSGNTIANSLVSESGSVVSINGSVSVVSGLVLNTNNDPSTVGNVATWIKITKTYADLAAAALTNNVTLLTLPAGCVVHMIKTIHTVAFVGPSITAYTVSVGITGTAGKYTSAFDVFQAASGTTQQLTTVNETENNSGTTVVEVNAASVGANLSVATAGSVDFYVLMSKANS